MRSLFRSPIARISRARRLAVLVSAALMATLSATTSLRAQRGTAVAAHPAAASAWSLPEPNELIQRVFNRIVAQDKPGAVPIAQYERRTVGRKETIEAVQDYLGHPVEIAAHAFAAVDGWKDARKLETPSCDGSACPVTVNAVWLAVTKIEKGATPNVLHVWYSTSFAANTGGTSQRQSYAFCERWVRVDNAWKYEGFVRVVTLPGAD